MHDPLEAREDALGRVADDVGQDVEAAAVRHPHRDLVDREAGRALDEPVQKRDRGVAAFDGVAPLSQELGAQEALEGLGRDELLEEGLAQRRRQRVAAAVDVAAAMRSRIQYFSIGLEMKRYSVPILPQ